MTVGILDDRMGQRYETLNDRIANLERKTSTEFPSHVFYNSLFIDEATIGFSKTHIDEFTHYPKCLKAIGMGIGELVVKDERMEDGSEHGFSYGIDLLEWEAIISYNKGKGPHWNVLARMFMPHIERIIEERERRPDVYICTQSKYYVDKNCKDGERVSCIEVNGAKSDGTYEQELKEWTGKEVKRNLWVNLDNDTMRSLMDSQRGSMERLYSIRDEDFLCNCFSEHENEKYLLRA